MGELLNLWTGNISETGFVCLQVEGKHTYTVQPIREIHEHGHRASPQNVVQIPNIIFLYL